MRLRPLHRNRSVTRRLPSITESLGDVDAPDLLGARQVRNSPRDPQHAVEAARREAHCRRGVGE